MSSETHEFGAATSIGQMTKLFVCYHAVTALTERFCQNAEIRPTLPVGAVAVSSPPPNPTVELDRSHWLAAKLDPQVASPAPGRDRLGPVSTSRLRCDHCRRELGFGVRCYWGMRFCSSACMADYELRLAEETKEKIRRLDVAGRNDLQKSSSEMSFKDLWKPAA